MESNAVIIPKNYVISLDTFMENLLTIDELVYFSLHVVRNEKKRGKGGAELGIMTLSGLVPEPVVQLLVGTEKYGHW